MWGIDGVLYIAGYGGVERYDGNSWETLSVPVGLNVVTAIWGFGLDDLLLGGFRFTNDPDRPMGAVAIYDHGSGSSYDLDTAFSVRDLWGTSAADAFALCFCLYQFDGDEWIPITPPRGVDRICGTPGGDLIGVPTARYPVLLFDGLTWEEIRDPNVNVAFDKVYGGLHVTPDGCIAVVGFEGAQVCDSEGELVAVAIVSLGARATTNGIELTWEVIADEPIARFRLFREDVSLGKIVVIDDAELASPDARHFVDRTATAGVTYSYCVVAVRLDGTEIRSYEIEASLPLPVLALAQNVPNPFNPTTRIAYTIPADGWVELRLYDTTGALVTTLVDQFLPVGRHEAIWRGLDANGLPVGSGVYLARLTFGGRSVSKKLTLLR
jgi:hypothetical protein